MSGTTNEVAIRIDTIETAMREDPAGYWRDEDMQARYRGLLDARDNGTPAPPPPAAETREIARIEQTMRDDPRAYWRDKGMQDRYRSLLARQAGLPDDDAPAAQTDTSHEIARIEKMMGDRKSEYWKSPALQEKYRNLVAQRDGLTDATSPANDTALAAWRSVVPSDVLADWEEGGSLEASTARLTGAVQTIAAGLEEEMPVRLFLDSFDALPAGAKSVVLREVGRGASTLTKRATEAEMKTWGQLYGGQEMLAAWGNRARQHVGIAMDRMGRITDSMTANDRAAWNQWLSRTIAPRARQCLLFAMGAEA